MSPYILIFILSILPVIFTYGALPIWGDTIMPLNSLGLDNYLYQWNSLRGGMYFSLNYLPYQLFFKIIETFTDSPYIASSILLLLLKMTAGLGVFRVSRLLFPTNRSMLYMPSIAFYLLSPSLLNSSHYLYIYSVAPWFLYFIFKMIKTKKMTLWDSLCLTILLFFGSVNLPNPKYVFHLFIIGMTTLISSLYVREIKLSFFFKNITPILIFLATSSYLVVPQLVFVRYYNPQKYDVHTKSGYQDVGPGIDYGESTLGRMWRLRKDSLNLNLAPKNEYTSDPLITFASFILPALIIAHSLFGNKLKKSHKNPVISLLVLTAVYLFFASGHNPPLGFVYEALIDKVSLLAFLRTTAGATFFLSLFYSLLIQSFVSTTKSEVNQNRVFVWLVVAIGLIGHPHLTGEIYKNVEVVVPTDQEKRGFVIPVDYFEAKKTIDNFKYDLKFLYPKTDLSYISTTWGYFGVAIYDFLYHKDNLNCSSFGSQLFQNVGVIFNDKSLLGKYSCTDQINTSGIIFNSGMVELHTLPIGDIYPHFHTSASSSSTIEFKKVNPSKYRVRIHSASKEFDLHFLENYHPGWKLYQNKMLSTGLSQLDLDKYQIYGGNEQFQATPDELLNFQKNNWVSISGDRAKNNIQFISKKNKGTIQNDNLPKGSFWETWGLSEVSQRTVADEIIPGSVNSWKINPELICKDSNKCIQNNDGSYETEFLVEFEPQRYYYMSLYFSVITFLVTIIYSIFKIKLGKNHD